MNIFDLRNIQIEIDRKFYCYFCAKELKKHEDILSQTYDLDDCSCENAHKFTQNVRIFEDYKDQMERDLKHLYENNKSKDMAAIKIQHFTNQINKEYGIK